MTIDPLAAAALAVLLLVNVGWSIALYRKLCALQAGRNHLRQYVAELDAAVGRTRDAVGELRREAGEIEAGLRRYGEGARLRGEQLNKLCENAGRLARRLEVALDRAPREPLAGNDRAGTPPAQAAANGEAAATAGLAPELRRLFERLR